MRGYDLYLLAIAKLLNSNYSRLLSFYFHTLIQQCRKIKYNIYHSILSLNLTSKKSTKNVVRQRFNKPWNNAQTL